MFEFLVSLFLYGIASSTLAMIPLRVTLQQQIPSMYNQHDMIVGSVQFQPVLILLLSMTELARNRG